MTGFTVHQAGEIDLLLRAAGRAEIMPRFRKLTTGVRAKTGPLDLVTDADEAAEAMIAQGLSRHFPGCLVVGEEAASREAALLGRLAGADLAFVVDPIDGTSNYAAGLPLFGTMAAAIARGEGAWEQAADGTRQDLRVAAAAPVERMTGTASWRYLAPELRRRVLPNLARPAQVYDLRCAAHEYRMLAGGHCHFLLFNRLMPWDHLPGWLLHREAGGFSARFDGSGYRPSMIDGGLICAPDRDSFLALRHALLEQAA